MEELQNKLIALNGSLSIQRAGEYLSVGLIFLALLSKLVIVHLSFMICFIIWAVILCLLLQWQSKLFDRRILLYDEIASWLSTRSVSDLNQIVKFALKTKLDVKLNRLMIGRIYELFSILSDTEKSLHQEKISNTIAAINSELNLGSSVNAAKRILLLIGLSSIKQTNKETSLPMKLKRLARQVNIIRWLQRGLIPFFLIILAAGTINKFMTDISAILAFTIVLMTTPNWIPYWKQILMDNNDEIILLAGYAIDVAMLKPLLDFMAISPPVSITLDDTALSLTILLPEIKSEQTSSGVEIKELENVISLKWVRRTFIAAQYNSRRLSYFTFPTDPLPHLARRLMITAMDTLGRIGNADTLVLLRNISQNSKEADINNAASLASAQLESILTMRQKQILH